MTLAQADQVLGLGDYSYPPSQDVVDQKSSGQIGLMIQS